MLLDLNDPLSIVRWWEVYPERHGPLLQDLARRLPQFRHPIAQASRLIEDSPHLHEALGRARRAQQALDAAPSLAWHAEVEEELEDTSPLPGRQDLAPAPTSWH